jgi:lipopolysaccharide transport system ATP-binding protein
MRPAIRVDNLSKRYCIGTRQRAANGDLRETITSAFTGLWRRVRGVNRFTQTVLTQENQFWALKGVSFEVRPGEIVGVIGRNGAGKSTLLKILSRIVEPTSGRAEIRGRVGSLLEVGTGFHPELTGRENIYLNGSILGMSRREIDRSFDEIVAFSEVEMFLDTPIKRYSSGMYVRLAFAVAAHLRPEILIVDEVLAVGDTAFQKTCLAKIREIGAHGRTILFVSHNLGSLQHLCGRGILLRRGIVSTDLPINQAIESYLQELQMIASEPLDQRTDRNGSGEVRLRALRICMGSGTPTGILAAGRPAVFEFHLSCAKQCIEISFTIFDDLGNPVSNFDTHRSGPQDRFHSNPTDRLFCRLDELPLLPGKYRVNAMVRVNRTVVDQIEAAALFEVEAGVIDRRRSGNRETLGRVQIPHEWHDRLD